MSEIKVPYGIIPVPPTPFDSNDRIDHKAFADVINYQIENKAHWLCVGGSTGEFTTMDMVERKELFDCALDTAKGKIPTMMHTSCHTLKDTLELSAYAVDKGADALMILTPFYLKTTREGTYQYFEAIAKAFPDTGICIYNVPHNTSVNITPEEVIELAKIPNIVAIKDCTDPTHTNEIIQGTKGLVFESSTGREAMILPNLAQGGSGGMGVLAAIFPGELVQMYDHIMNNDWKKAAAINERLRQMALYVDAEPNPAPVKAALSMLGFECGVPRLPVQACSSELKELMYNEMKRLGYNVRKI